MPNWNKNSEDKIQVLGAVLVPNHNITTQNFRIICDTNSEIHFPLKTNIKLQWVQKVFTG